LWRLAVGVGGGVYVETVTSCIELGAEGSDLGNGKAVELVSLGKVLGETGLTGVVIATCVIELSAEGIEFSDGFAVEFVASSIVLGETRPVGGVTDVEITTCSVELGAEGIDLTDGSSGNVRSRMERERRGSRSDDGAGVTDVEITTCSVELGAECVDRTDGSSGNVRSRLEGRWRIDRSDDGLRSTGTPALSGGNVAFGNDVTSLGHRCTSSSWGVGMRTTRACRYRGPCVNLGDNLRRRQVVNDG
jgi:hypothetical protein